MFRRHYKRSPNIIFVIFRLILSMVMFTLLLAGSYFAYKHFSGLDPLKLDPQALAKNILPKILGQGVQTNTQTNLENLIKGKGAFRFMLVADSHNDNEHLRKAIFQAKADYPDISFIIGLGDYTDVGTIAELKNAKIELDSSGLRYFLIPGDHDLWDCRNRSLSPASCFKEVFGPNFQSFTYANFRFLLLDNSDDYQGLGETQMNWITTELEKAKNDQVLGIFVFIPEPLFHPSSEHIMGKVEKELKKQGRELIFKLKEAGVKKIFAGDIHYFSEYNEPETKLEMMTAGAVTSERNPQSSRFAIVSVFEDGTTRVEDVQIR